MPGRNQHWQVKGAYIYSSLNGKVMQADGLDAGSVVEMWTQAGPGSTATEYKQQYWTLVPLNSTGIPLGYFCRDAYTACGAANSVCITGRCMCKEGWVRDLGNPSICVEQRMLALGSWCNNITAPCGAFGSECRDYMCSCKSHMPIGIKCRKPFTTMAASKPSTTMPASG